MPTFPTLNASPSQPASPSSFPALPSQQAQGASSAPGTSTPSTNIFAPSFAARQANIQQTTQDYVNGKIGLPQAAFNNIGQVLMGALDIPTDMISGAAKEVEGKLGVDTNAPSSDEMPPLQEKLASLLATPEISTYQNAAKMYAHSADLYAQAHTTTDPTQKNRLITLADQMKGTADIIKSKAQDIDTNYQENGKTAEATSAMGGLILGDVNPEEDFVAKGASDLKNPVATVKDIAGIKPSAPAASAPSVTPEQEALSDAQAKMQQAASAREGATAPAVQGVRDINSAVASNKTTLGQQFASDASDLEKSNPNMRLSLSSEQVDALRGLKEGKNFSLPDSIKEDTNLNPSGKDVPSLSDYLDHPTQLSPTQTQDLIKELNRSTYKEMADGSRQIDYSRQGITNDIKNSASQAFGEPWDDIYSKYAAGRTAIDKISSITDLNTKATPEDLNNQLQGILKQSKTPEGKLLLQQAVNEYKIKTGVDLNDPIKAIQNIADKQTSLDAANDELTQAQRDANKAQRQADIERLKGGYVKQMIKGATSPGRLGSRLAWGVMGIGVVYPLIRAISAALKKQMQ